ncbi:MAG TPA: glycerol-3-phosphate acyltransferase, partial [Spirochaetia bacterium]|nr:glycerol-3-phosphate acyltransferase [Spirochaetia bacterium]
MWNLLIIVFASYLIGSIPAGVIASRIVRGLDIRGYGSGNTGATNVFRVLGWKAGLAVALVDFSKGFVSAFWISRLKFPDPEPSIAFLLPIFAGCSAVLGHIFPLFAGFRGGKGVATGA